MTAEFQFPRYIFLYSLLSIMFSFGITPFFISLVRRLGLMDKPGKFAHKIHAFPTPLAGGTTLIFCFIFLTVVLGLWDGVFTRALVIAAGIIYLFGLLDDIRGLAAIPKLTGQALAATVLILSGVSVHFIESLALPFLSKGVATWLDILLTLFWLTGITNAMNMIDSKDGIAVGVSGIALLFFVLITSLSGQIYLTEISILLVGITVGIYYFNVTPARLFLGDSGSQTYGFLIAAIAMEYAPVGFSPVSSWFVPILLVGMPIFDTTLVVFSRMRRGIPVYKANLDHTYHRLVALGLDERRAVLTIHLAAVVSSLIAFVTFYLSPLVANVIFGTLLVMGAIAIFSLDRNWKAELL